MRFEEWIGRSETVGHRHRDALCGAVRDARSRERSSAARNAAAAAVALALLPAAAPAIGVWARRPRAARRLPAAGSAAAADVGRQPVRVPRAAARRRHADAHVDDRRRHREDRALRSPRVRQSAPRDPPAARGRGRAHRVPRHRLSRGAASRRRRAGRDARARAAPRGNAGGCPTTCCCSATPRSRSTATGSTTTAATSRTSKAIRGSSSTARCWRRCCSTCCASAAGRRRRALRVPRGAPRLRPRSVLRLRRAAAGRQVRAPVDARPRGVPDDGRHRGPALARPDDAPARRHHRRHARTRDRRAVRHAAAGRHGRARDQGRAARHRRLRARLRRARARPRVALRVDEPVEGKPDARRQAPGRAGDPPAT